MPRQRKTSRQSPVGVSLAQPGAQDTGATGYKNVGSKADAGGLTACATREGKAHLGLSPLRGGLNEWVFGGPAALGGLAEGPLAGLEELSCFGEAD